jgi:hypothetical protein
MYQTLQAPEPIFSAYVHDPDLADLVAIFSEELPSRIAIMGTYMDGDEIGNLLFAAQQLRVSAVRYGFDQLAPCIQRLESLILDQSPRHDLETAFQDFVDTCDRVRPSVD